MSTKKTVTTRTYEYDESGILLKEVEVVEETHTLPTPPPLTPYPQPRTWHPSQGGQLERIDPQYPPMIWNGVNSAFDDVVANAPRLLGQHGYDPADFERPLATVTDLNDWRSVRGYL